MVSTIIVAGGKSTRMGFDKLLAKIKGEYVLEKSVNLFLNNEFIDEIILVISEKNKEFAEQIFKNKNVKIIVGGQRRQDSVKNGAIASTGDIIAIHDAARPFVSEKLISELINFAKKNGSCAPGIIPHSTVKVVDKNGNVTNTPNRDTLREIQTPQVFKREEYLKALEKSNQDVTDDCSIMENAGYSVHIIDGEETNIKLTTPEDFMPFKETRVGYGYDVHKLTENRKLIIGGIEIPYEKGLLGHSDADVLTHAIMDSLLGAASLGDIGKLFPDNDPKYLGADSVKLLCEVKEKIISNGFEINNIDATIIAQEPKMSPYIENMREKLSTALGISKEKINIKATTEEGLGFTGQKLGIAASAISSIYA